MKNIFNKMLGVCLTVVASAMFTGCSSDEEAVSQSAPQTGKFTLTVRAEKQGGTRALAVTDVDGDGIDDIQATWTAGDEVQVYDATTGEALTGVLTAQGSGASTLLTGTVEGTVSVGDALRLTFLSDDYSSQDGTLQYLAQHCDYAEATVTVGAVGNGEVTPTGNAEFVNAQAIVCFTLTDVTGASLSASALTVNYTTGSVTLADIPSSTYTVNGGTGVLFVALPPVSQQTVTLTATVGDDTYTYATSSAVTLTAGQYQPISVTMKEVVDRSGVIDGRAYVDLGLPSGTLWATCNIGADSPEDYGLYFAWGETVPYGGTDESNATNYSYAGTYTKTYYYWSTYKYSDGYGALIKYCNDSSDGYNGFTDNLTELLPEDDAATANWGAGWRMPSYDQFNELINSNYTTKTWTTVNGVYGRKITSKVAGYVGNFIFLPAAGNHYESSLDYLGSFGNYWSHTLFSVRPGYAKGLVLYSDDIYIHDEFPRANGLSVRPVRVSQ